MATRRTPKVNFTKRAIESLETPVRELSVFDEHTPGLGLLLYPSGTKSFFHLRYVRGYPRRTTVGRFPEITVDQARGKASELNSALSKWKLSDYSGDDPLKPRRRAPTLDALVTAYIEKHIRIKAKNYSDHGDRAVKAVEWQIKKYLPSWRNRSIGSIRKEDVADLHERLALDSGRPTANRTIQLLRRLFYWATFAKMWSGENPAAGAVKFFHEPERERFLQPDELRRLFTALAKDKNADLRDFVNLALWTGARRGDIFSMRWENLSLEHNHWKVPDPKNKKPYFIPLMPEAVDILKARKRRAKDSPWVFPSRGKTGHLVDLKTAWAKLLKRADLTDVRQHDLRRTLGSYQALAGASTTIIGKSLGHESAAATQIYARVNLDAVRASMSTATRTMIAAMTAKPPKLKPERKPKLLKASGS